MGMKHIIALLGTALLVTACSGETSPLVQSVQKKDKDLSCTEVLLEMNEAEFYKNTAQNNRQPKLKNVIMPLGYVSTYMNSQEAMNAANSRINYLNKIYDIMKCDSEQEQRYGSGDEPTQERHAQVKEEEPRRISREDRYAAPVPYVETAPARRDTGRHYVAGAYGQPVPTIERRLASAPYPDGYTPIRQRYEQRRLSDNRYYGYQVPEYEEAVPEGYALDEGY